MHYQQPEVVVVAHLVTKEELRVGELMMAAAKELIPVRLKGLDRKPREERQKRVLGEVCQGVRRSLEEKWCQW